MSVDLNDLIELEEPETEIEEREETRFPASDALLDRLPVHQKVEIGVAGTLSSAIQIQIYEMIRKADYPPFPTPQTFYWGWMIQHAEDGYNGTLPKRLSKLVFVSTGKYLSTKLQSDIGELAHRNLTIGRFVFDFDNDLGWEHGEFGDLNSCLLKGGNSYSRQQLVAMNCWAMRRWDKDRGMGRCWMMPGEHGLVLFNRYDRDREINLPDYVRCLAEYLSVGYVPVTIGFSNMSRVNYHLYINGSTHYLVGRDSLIRTHAGSEYNIPLIGVS